MLRPQHRSLHRDLLYNLAFLASAAVMIVGVTTAALGRVDPGATFQAMIALWAGSTVVFVLFAAYLIRRVVSRPLDQLETLAAHLATGETDMPDPDFDLPEFDRVSRRMRAMAEQLLEAHGEDGGTRSLEQSPAASVGPSS